MPSQPLVAIVADIRAVDGAQWHAASEQYIEAAVNGAGVTPIVIPALGDRLDVEGVLDVVDGVLLSGSRTNVHPALYGEDSDDGIDGPFDPARDATSAPIIRRALARDLPILAICRGMQELTVAMGGTLAREIQDWPGRLDHRTPEVESRDERFALRQPVKLAEGGLLAGMTGCAGVMVNSLHRQAADRLPDGLRAEAWAEDGTIEAISAAENRAFVLGVQWHPEYWVKTDETSAIIFKAFGDQVRNHARRRSQMRGY